MGVKRPGEENAPEEPAKRHADGASKPLPAAHLPPSAETRRMLLRDSGWPLDVLNDPAKQPRLLSSADEFVRELMYGEHMDEIVVLRNGCELLQQQGAVPTPITGAIQGNKTVRAFLRDLGEETRRTHNARVYYLDESGRHTRQLRRDAGGKELKNLQEKLAELERREELADQSMYIAELRRTTKFRHVADGGWAKTALTCDVKDYVGVDRAALIPYWDRFDEGVFVGGRHSGSAMHVDQCGWSNIGKNWVGYKLVALWPYGETSNRVLDTHLDKLFNPPITADDIAILRQACRIALVEPGDALMFSGAQAHATLCVGEGLCLGAYESFINLNPLHAEVFISTNHAEMHWRECHASLSDLRDIKLDVCDQINDAIGQLSRQDPLTQQRMRAAIQVFRADPFLATEIKPIPLPRKGTPRTDSEDSDEDLQEKGAGAGSVEDGSEGEMVAVQ